MVLSLHDALLLSFGFRANMGDPWRRVESRALRPARRFPKCVRDPSSPPPRLWSPACVRKGRRRESACVHRDARPAQIGMRTGRCPKIRRKHCETCAQIACYGRVMTMTSTRPALRLLIATACGLAWLTVVQTPRAMGQTVERMGAPGPRAVATGGSGGDAQRGLPGAGAVVPSASATLEDRKS